MARALAGDSGAFTVLVHRYAAVAHAVAMGVLGSEADAEDVVQDAFLLTYRELRSVRDPASFRAWLLRIVRNRAYNVLEFKRVRRHEVLSGYEPASDDDDPSSLAERSDARAAIMRAMDTLKPVLREVLWLHDVEGFAHAEIAELLRTSELMSRKHLMNARRALKVQLHQHRGDA